MAEIAEANEYIEFNDSLRDNEPEQTNAAEKDDYTLFNEQIQRQRLLEKENISYGDTTWGKTILTGLDNLPTSVINTYVDSVKGLYQSLRHPVTTGTALKRAVVGGIKSGIQNIPDDQLLADPTLKSLYSLKKSAPMESDKDIEAWDAIEKELYNTFGTEENFKKFIAENPGEALQTLSELVIPLAKVAKLPKVAAIASKIDPIDVTRAMAETVKNKVLSKNVSAGLYRRALKLGDTIPQKRKDRILEVAQKNRLNVDMESFEKLDLQIKEINKAKDEILASKLNKYPVKEMFKRLDEFERDMLKVSSAGSDIKKPIRDFKKRIVEANEYLGRKDLSLTEINDYKVQFNKELDEFYDKMVSSAKDAPINKKIVANASAALRETVEEAIPELSILRFPKLSRRIIKKNFGKKLSIKEVNMLQGDLIELRNVIQDHANSFSTGKIMDFQVGQKTATGAFAGAMLGTAVAGEAGKDIGLYLGGAAGLALGTIDSSPRIKMQLANTLNTMKILGIPVKPSATLIRLGLYEAGDYAREFHPELEIQGD